MQTFSFEDLYVRLFQELQQTFSLCTVVKDGVINIFFKFIDNDAYTYPTGQSLLKVVIGIILVLIFATYMSRPPKEISLSSRTALQALQTVLVPTCSLWPARYIQLVKRASDHGSRSKIVVSLSMLLQDVCDGVIELRDPICDLEDLMDGGVSAYGCCVCLSIGWKWWVEWLDRVVRVYDPDLFLAECSPVPRSVTRRNLRWVYALLCLKETFASYAYIDEEYDAVDSSHPPTSTQLVRLLTTGPSPSLDHESTIDLDSKPLKHLVTIELPKGSRAIVEFTSICSSISGLSTTHMICMIPFLARRLPHRLSDVLAAVADTRHFKLSSLMNSSATYSDALAVASCTLTDDPVAIKQYVEELGIKGWRERKLMLDLEAALVRRGWLEHWNMELEG